LHSKKVSSFRQRISVHAKSTQTVMRSGLYAVQLEKA